MSYTEGALLCEGKTKGVYLADGQENVVILENRNKITANDNKDLTRQFDAKAVCATTTTCRIFELLREAGIPVAYLKQISKTKFASPRVEMIPLEVVGRRYAVGSYLKRHPELTKAEGETPYRFHRLKAEFFLKTSDGGKLRLSDGSTMDFDLDPKTGEEDPFISDAYAESWDLCHSKKPSWDKTSLLRLNALRPEMLGLSNDDIQQMEELLRQVFLVLEGAWATLGLRLIDIKIEFGRDQNGKIFVADVIDNDSWRLRTQGWKELSKQVFRENGLTAEVEENYQTVADLSEQLAIPRQAIVFWCGSEKDSEALKNLETEIFVTLGFNGHLRYDMATIFESGHKAPIATQRHLEKLQADYPQGGVILDLVGMSNGLGPTIAAATNWPVINVPLTAKQVPEDVWSSLRLPSLVPAATILNGVNAYLCALNILSLSNPFAYMLRRLMLENLDREA